MASTVTKLLGNSSAVMKGFTTMLENILCTLTGDAGHVSAAGVIHAQSGGDVHQHVWWGRQQTDRYSCQEI